MAAVQSAARRGRAAHSLAGSSRCVCHALRRHRVFGHAALAGAADPLRHRRNPATSRRPPSRGAPPQQHLYHVRGPQQLLMKYAHIVRPIVAHASEHSALCSYLHTPAPARVVIRTLPETRTYTAVLRPSSALKKSVRRLPPYVTPLSTLFVQGFQSQPRS